MYEPFRRFAWQIHQHRRALLIYLVAIVAPILTLLWLGLQSFERQRQAVATLTREKLEAMVDTEARSAADAAFANHAGPIALSFFEIAGGRIERPALDSLLPLQAPQEIAEAERLELAEQRPELALVRYRALVNRHVHESLALHGMARSLATTGHRDEARDTWRHLAKEFPDDRDLAGRPYGIVAAINAGDTDGLFDLISSGRWDLPADQAEYFLRTLDAHRPAPFLERYALARELDEHFRIPATLQDGEVTSESVSGRRIFVRQESAGRIVGFEADPSWMQALNDRLAASLDVIDTSRQAVAFYGSAVVVVLVVLSAGLVLLIRDVSRDARINQLRSDFVNGVTHELKTPVTIMRLYAETLLRQRNLEEDERREFYRTIGRESTRLGRLVDQVLTFSKVERGDERYEMEDGDLAPVIAGIVDDYGDWLEHAGFAVERTLPESAPLVRFDPAALSQAVVNLLDNAVKYSGTSRTIGARLGAANGEVTFEVEDHGPGIPSADREKIFERFYRAPNGNGKGGYGLGLYMVRRIMEAHGGRAEVDSSAEHGSCFRLVFPVAAS